MSPSAKIPRGSEQSIDDLMADLTNTLDKLLARGAERAAIELITTKLALNGRPSRTYL